MLVNQVRGELARAAARFFVIFTGIALFAVPVAYAQEGDEDETGSAATQAEAQDVEEITVTGSRLKRDTYSSIAPLQVVSGQMSREIGAIDPSTILQDSTASAGTQIDITFQGFVLDNGPGSSTIDLRGLGAERSLVLINGRRAAPAGVEGAPFAPDLNIIPSSLVDRYEILLDGASSVYGSDALAGVANIILRKDFDGLELEAYTTIPEYSNGVENTISAAWGVNGDRGFFGIAADYGEGEPVAREDRPWSEGCESFREIDENGEIRTENIAYQYLYGMKSSPCVTAFGSQRTFDNVSQLFGSIYFTEGQTNTGIPNFSEATLYEVPLDLNNDGIPDVDFTDYWITNEDGGTNLLPDRERISVMSYGEYTFSGDMNLTPYYEANYNKREFFALSLGAVIQQEAPANNPFNPINPNGLNGVDIGQAYNSVVNNPSYIEDFGLYYEGLCARFGFPLEACTPSLFGLVIPGDGSIGAFPLEAQFSVRGDRDFVQTEVDQTRVVAGLKGDLPMFSAGDFDNWSFDLAFVYNDARGTSLRRGINEEKLIYSLETSVIVPGTSDVVCGTDTDGDGIPDSGDCVPVNMYAPSLYQSLLSNEFASQAERDYLFSDRTFVTDYKQTTANLLLTGDLFSLPAGTVAAALGYEYRSDEIDSIPNDVARDGLLWGYFRDLGAVGEKDTKEWFAEVEVPIFANESRIKELTMNLSTRHTDDEFYGGAWTYSGKLAWRPVDNLLFRGTVGTSYRAPNLRENFLLGTSGFLSLADPCVVPEEALVLSPEGIVYDPEKDTRTQVVLNNCVADGTDPTSLGRLAGGATTPVYGVEILRSVGDTALDEEKSESWTVGLSWDEQIFRNLDVSVGLTYYEIEIINEIVSRSSQGSINSCYGDAEGDSPFCRNIDREALPGGGFGLISEVRENFLNRDGLKTRGLDINVALDLPTQMFGRAVDFGLDLSFNRKYEFSDVFIDTETGTVSRDSDLGEFGLPKWEGQGILRADIGDFRLTWSTRYLSSVEADPDLVELLPFGNVDDGASWTCLGPDNGDVNCRPVYFADKYFRHDMSIYYYGDTWTFGIGARNVTDQAPPLVDGRAVFSGWNVPYGNGYDVNGRQYFANVAVRFDSLTF